MTSEVELRRDGRLVMVDPAKLTEAAELLAAHGIQFLYNPTEGTTAGAATAGMSSCSPTRLPRS